MYDDMAMLGRPERRGRALHLEQPDGGAAATLASNGTSLMATFAAERAALAQLPSRSGASWRGYARLSTQSITDLRWWAALRGSRHVGRAIWRRPDSAVLHTANGDGQSEKLIIFGGW